MNANGSLIIRTPKVRPIVVKVGKRWRGGVARIYNDEPHCGTSRCFTWNAVAHRDRISAFVDAWFMAGDAWIDRKRRNRNLRSFLFSLANWSIMAVIFSLTGYLVVKLLWMNF